MKKISFIFLLSFIFLFFTTTFAYADSFYRNEKNLLFEITSGIDMQKESLTTFDKNRTITGTSQKGTNITISVYQKNTKKENTKNTEQDVYREVYKYSLIVGPSGYFTQSIDLLVGENFVVITSEKEGKTSSSSTIIKRKNSEIKSELESNIVLPISRK